MELVQRHRDALARLQDRWDQLALLAQMSGIAADIGSTAEEFSVLTNTLLGALSQRLHANAIAALRAKSQVAIDILVRNLFERTADVGFLATDGEVCAFARAASTGGDADASALQRRLQAYVRKYSVYDDVIVLGDDGRVLARLDESVQVSQVRHPLVAASLRGERAFIESFGDMDVLGGRRGLVYSAPIRQSSGAKPLGVLCLSFRLDDELAGIFRGLLQPGEAAQLILLDGADRVLASSDCWQLPHDAPVPRARDDARMMFAGREYLAVATPSAGYQGYGGPKGWRMAALLPLDLAFSSDEAEPARSDLDAKSLARITLFGQTLQQVPHQARHMQRGLELSVWNGQLRARQDERNDAYGGSRFAAALLGQVADAGARIRAVFEIAIGDLQQSAVAEVVRQANSASALAVDILDRNLYERANDCRWWALDAQLQRALTAPDDATRESAMRTLAHINGLYTVYAQLLLIDATGRVCAASRPHDAPPSVASLAWFKRSLSLPDDQGWTRSAFEPCAFYGERPTYVYAAAVRESGRNAGCVAIVFDSAPQMAAMLQDALPRGLDGRPLPQAAAVFATRRGQVLSCAGGSFAVGDTLPFAADFAALARGAGADRIMTIDGALYVAAASMAGGYREYGTSPGVADDDVMCIVLIRLGEAAGDAHEAAPMAARFEPRVVKAADSRTLEIASFAVAGHWYGMPVSSVVAAVQVERMTVLPDGRQSGVILHEGMAISVHPFAQSAASEDQLVVICRAGNGRRFGIRVDQMGTVFSTTDAAVQAIPPAMAQHDPLAEGLLRSEGAQGDLMTLIGIEKLAHRLCGPAAAAQVQAVVAEPAG